ncbi:8368_t:CDS:2, partial [Racocetra persica]
DNKTALSHDAQLFNSRELYLEESHQWIQTKQRPQYDDNDPDVVMQGEGDKDAMDIDDDFETEFDKRMTMIVAFAASDSDEQNMKGLKFHYTYGGEVQTEGEAAASACSESIKPLLDHIIKDSLDYSRETDVNVLSNFSSLQVLINLLSNSLKFTDTGEIVLRVTLDELEGESSTNDENVKKGKLCVEVIDSGIGIDPAFIQSIWESFSQGDQSMTRRQDGTGLGLSICKHLVTINGGKIGVESEIKKGSRFWFTWNIERLSLSSVPITTMSKTPDTINLSSRSKRVLIVDYSDLSRQTLVKLVEGSVERINAFGSCEECITTVKAWQEQYHDEALFDIVFFNVRENISEEIKNSAKELRRIFDDNLCIVLIVFWSANGRALGQNLVQEIGGKTCMICKPVMQRRLVHCLYSRDFVSEPYAPTIQNEYYSSVKPLADLRIENFYRSNRPPFSDETVKESSNLEKSPMVVSEETAKSSIERIRKEDLPAVNIPGTESLAKGKGKNVESAQSGTKRMADDETENTTTPTDDRASKFRFRPVSKSKCILCVEDNPINLKVIQHQLSKLGYPSLCATNGQEAVNLIESEYSNYSQDASSSDESNPGRIALILMDCAMPIMSGFDASRAIRSMNTPISNVPIIALTASAVQGTKEQCLESGMNDYLTKPLKIAKLKEMLDQWLGNNESNE